MEIEQSSNSTVNLYISEVRRTTYKKQFTEFTSLPLNRIYRCSSRFWRKVVDICAQESFKWTPFPSVHLKQYVDWMELFMAQSNPLYLFSIHRARTVCKHQRFFWAHTLNTQLEDQEEQFAEFDKKCIGLQSRTVPLTRQWWVATAPWCFKKQRVLST